MEGRRVNNRGASNPGLDFHTKATSSTTIHLPATQIPSAFAFRTTQPSGMSSPTAKAANKATAVLAQGDAVVRASTIPAVLRFPIVVTLSLTLSALLYSVAAEYTAGDLARVSRTLDQWWQVSVLIGWRTFELGLGWFGDYDGYDLASLSLLSHGPPLYLLGSFYEIHPVTVISSLLIDALATYIPFRLLRPLSLAHSASTSKHSLTVRNKDIITSNSIQIYTTILAGSIYAVTLFTSYTTFLPVYLVTYFDGIPSIAAAHTNSIITLFPTTFLLGLAAKSFIFTPTITASPTDEDVQIAAFHPETATLEETFWFNVWGYNSRKKVMIKRTATLMLVTGVNTFVQTFVTIDGVEAVGAVVYSAVWVTAALITGVTLGLVGDV
ncbi:uncharacterized protein RAG0_09383 [Rhynchosporium agropyri]|uniref:Uncharacterized protein n=1 Tax=Rhynchosporium agropyri TaxID=914238 RepID=A0A1E1KV93_9HELO|nr:uncharacterized protein RAG0_09383 [Rhynchosporium agropyri]